jgi:hypothetical protein
MVSLDDADLNETLFARVTKRVVVHPQNILEIHLSFLPAPIYLQYKTEGKGKFYNAIFDVVPSATPPSLE